MVLFRSVQFHTLYVMYAVVGSFVSYTLTEPHFFFWLFIAISVAACILVPTLLKLREPSVSVYYYW